MDREAWRAAVHVVAKSRTRLSDWTEPMGNFLVSCTTTYYVCTNSHMQMPGTSLFLAWISPCISNCPDIVGMLRKTVLSKWYHLMMTPMAFWGLIVRKLLHSGVMQSIHKSFNVFCSKNGVNLRDYFLCFLNVSLGSCLPWETENYSRQRAQHAVSALYMFVYWDERRNPILGTARIWGTEERSSLRKEILKKEKKILFETNFCL